MVANIDMLRACSTATNMSDARCCRLWNVPMATPNCLRVLMYSTVGLERLVHQADRLGAQRGASVVNDALDQSEAIIRVADHGIRADLNAGEGDVGGVQAVLGRVGLLGDALGIGGHQEDADAAFVAALALGAGR